MCGNANEATDDVLGMRVHTASRQFTALGYETHFSNVSVNAVRSAPYCALRTIQILASCYDYG